MPDLKPVGIYREMYRKVREDLPALSESKTARVIPDRDPVVAYLKAGVPVFDVLEDVQDLIEGAEWIRSGPSLLSDGVWVWRMDSIYYLERYSLEIPEEFLAHVRGRNFEMATDLDLADASFDVAISAYF